MDRREFDADLVKPFVIQVYGSITCWKSGGKDSEDMQLTSELVRCAPDWRGKKLWRCDCVWMTLCYEAGG
jgi:hypothetical protein